MTTNPNGRIRPLGVVHAAAHTVEPVSSPAMNALHQFINRLGLKSFGGNTFGGYAGTVAAEVRPEHGRMRISGTCTTGNLDRSREIVVPAGVDWSEYKQNPIFTLSHGWKDPSKIIGRCEVEGQFAVRQKAYGGGGGGWDFTAQLFKTGPNAALAAETMDAVDSGALRGVSLGFRFIDPDARQITAPDGMPALRIDRCKPFEITLVPTPDNPDAIVRIVEKGLNGRRLSAPLMSMFRPLVPKAKYHGFTTQNRRTKAMNPLTQDPSQQQPPGGGDPSQMGQQPPPAAPPMPTQKPSIALLLALEQYIMGIIRLCNDQTKVQESDEMKQMLPALILHFSEAYRSLANTHQQIQMKDQSFPNMMGHGGLLASPPTPDGMGGGPGGMPGSGMGFGDGLDGANGSEINAGLTPMTADPAMAGPPPGDDDQSGDMGGDMGGAGAGGGGDDLFAGLGDDDEGGADAGGMGGMGDADGDEGAGAGMGDGDGDEYGASEGGKPFGGDGDEEEEDDTDAAPLAAGKKKGPPPPKKRQKGFAMRHDMVQRVREKGQAAALQRADALLAAFSANMRREYGDTDLNWLRWGAENVVTCNDPKKLHAMANWCRMKSLEGTRPVVDERAELERLVAEELARRTAQV